MSESWVLYACRSSYVADVAEVVWRRNAEVMAYIDNMPDAGPLLDDLTPVFVADGAPDHLKKSPTTIPLMTPGHRYAAHVVARQQGWTRFPVLVDPTAVVPRRGEVGEGSSINAAVTIGGRARIGEFVVLNRRSSVGHHSVLEDFVSLGPGCVLGGHVTLRTGAFIGTGAVCAPEVTVGPNAVVGAGAVVVRDVPGNTVVVGNPARPIRDVAGFGNVGVPTT